MGSFGLAEFDPPVSIPAFAVSAKLTGMARKLIARGAVDGTSLRAIEFGVGTGGYSPFDPTTVIPVDENAGALIEPVLLGQTITHYESPNLTSGSFYCLLPAGTANYLLGEVGLWALVRIPPAYADTGNKILFALGHFPAKAKNSNMAMAIRVVLQS